MTIPPEAFWAIQKELERQPLHCNKYRVKAGTGRSQAFGLVNRRCLAPDYSRTCWKRPYLYGLLLEFADKYVKIPWNAITVNQNYQAMKHKDKGNVGESLVVAFGDYEGGELAIYNDGEKELVDVRHKPIVRNFSETWHSVEPFTGNRYSLVFYVLNSKGIDLSQIPPPSVVFENGKWWFKRGDKIIRDGLDHPLKGRTKKPKPILTMTVEHKDIIIDLN